MKYLISKLEGELLDRAVAIADETPDRHPFKPSSCWNDGGPIIFKANMAIEPARRLEGKWQAFTALHITDPPQWVSSSLQYGSTPLIAAMRSYVMSKIGDGDEDNEVDL